MQKILKNPVIRGLATVVVVISWAVVLISTLAFFCYAAPMILFGSQDPMNLVPLAGMTVGSLVGYVLHDLSFLDN